MDLIYEKDYYLREVDIFKDVDHQKYQDCVKDPHIALKNATVTYMINVLINRLDQMEKLNAFKNEESGSELVLNIYPYKLEQSVVDMIRDAIFIKLGLPVFITIVNDPDSVWSPNYIKNCNVSHFYKYDAAEWLNKYGEQLSTGILREVRLFFPSLGKQPLDKAQVKEVQKAGFKDVFSYTEFLFSPYTKLQFLPAVFYCNLVLSSKVLQGYNEELMRTPLKQEEGGGDEQQTHAEQPKE